MAYKFFDGLSADSGAQADAPATLQIDGQMTVELPDASFVRDAELTRDGMDLLLEGPNGNIVIENYFAADPAPDLMAPTGETLTPELVQSFAKAEPQYAQQLAMNDASAVGHVEEVSGEATVTHTDGSVETITIGTRIFQGDIIETDAAGAVSVRFMDDTTFAVSQDARLAIDEYVFDPESQSGSSDFSVLKGVFVFTSGLIGRDDPDDVKIDTPVGSIGIRGTIIMGNVDTGEITVVEGAIVLRDFQGHEITLASQFESAKFVPGGEIESLGILNAGDVSNKFASIGKVTPTLFSSLEDAATEDNSMLVASTIGAEDSMEQTVSETLAVETAPAETTEVAAAETAPADVTPVNPVTETLEAQPLPPPPPPGGNTFTGQTSGFDSKMTAMATSTLPPPPPSGTSTTTAANNTLPPPPVNTATAPNDGTVNGTLPPPLMVNVQSFAIQENFTGSNILVARLTGQFSPSVTYSLIDPMNAYHLVMIDAVTAEIRMNNLTTAFDKEGHNIIPPLGFTATNASGTTTINGALPIIIGNVNENPVWLSPDETGVHAPYFQASEGSNWSLDLRQIFFDQDVGDHLSYRLSGSALPSIQDAIDNGFITSINIDAAGNILGDVLNITFANDFFNLTGSPDFLLEIQAVDSGGYASGYYSHAFDVSDSISTGMIPSTISGTSSVHSDRSVSGNNDNITIIGDNNLVFTNRGDDMVTINNDDNEVHGGDGADSFTVSGTATSNTLIGGRGNDVFNINGGQVNNRFYGMDGNDTFNLDHLSASNLAGSSFANAAIDGGVGFDTLHLLATSAVDLNFNQIFDVRNNKIQNIERIDTKNGVANTIMLDFEDVLRLTGQDNKLKIDLDADDSVELDLNSETVSTRNLGDGNTEWTISSGGETVTLIIENVGTVNVV